MHVFPGLTGVRRGLHMMPSRALRAPGARQAGAQASSRFDANDSGGIQVTELTASVDHITWCADEFTRAGEGVAGAYGGAPGEGAADTAAAVGALGPVFGALGGGFLEAFATAHAAHARSVSGLSEVLVQAGATAAAIARAYAGHESGQAAALTGREVAL